MLYIFPYVTMVIGGFKGISELKHRPIDTKVLAPWFGISIPSSVIHLYNATPVPRHHLFFFHALGASIVLHGGGFLVGRLVGQVGYDTLK